MAFFDSEIYEIRRDLCEVFMRMQTIVNISNNEKRCSGLLLAAEKLMESVQILKGE